ncbi:RagB/SusD family nutrient uptake outer membrane protein [Deminuibacter soli]|uniref:RagB/SusD family nutrient uptake outer membrane protein n=1 Tax=Deminuibacter soli TaxID=2291815 RepID=A0A3E1NIQ9_9BACT|nr:RagB/SusD family nutrient uptake outer membrane protein [Deminuibacter soli]RFM27836.1 RagB/SusD family nutrient uptake outer membrane protein [Deminuibacter soli]
MYTIMQILRYRLFASALIMLSAIAGCKKFVTVPPPAGNLVSPVVFVDQATAVAAQIAIYTDIENKTAPYYTSLLAGLAADELTSFSADPFLSGCYTNSLIALTQNVSDIWTISFNSIYRANAVLEGVGKSTTLSPFIVKQLMGEAKFIRAYLYFNLVNFYGDIPLLLSTDYTSNRLAARTPASKVYDQIVTDLKDAETNLSNSYLNATDTLASSERVRPNKATASAMLARVYLFQKDWANAAAEASAVINQSTVYSLNSDLNSVFLRANNKEAIFQIQAVKPTINSVMGANFVLLSTPSAGTSNCTTISKQLLNSFETGDKRKQAWVGSVSVGANTYNFPNKYKIKASATITEYTTVLRLAEQYLILAEANAQMGDTKGALSNLNIVRKRAGLADFSAQGKDSVLAAIQHERQIELFAEGAFRWFDLKRTNTADSIMAVVTPLKGGKWNNTAQLFPIPQIERDADPLLSQNPGY